MTTGVSIDNTNSNKMACAILEGGETTFIRKDKKSIIYNQLVTMHKGHLPYIPYADRYKKFKRQKIFKRIIEATEKNDFENALIQTYKKRMQELITICDKLPEKIKFSPARSFGCTKQG